MKRIFLALPISERLQKEIGEWSARYHHWPVRWLAGKNLHLTLIPPWYEKGTEIIKEKLKELEGRVGDFSLIFEEVTFGPEPSRPRLIWSAGPTPARLIQLKTKLEEVLRRAPEKRPFRLHLTLARFRPENFSGFPVKNIEEKIFWPEEIKTFVLMESHLARAGADYEILEEFKL